MKKLLLIVLIPFLTQNSLAQILKLSEIIHIYKLPKNEVKDFLLKESWKQSYQGISNSFMNFISEPIGTNTGKQFLVISQNEVRLLMYDPEQYKNMLYEAKGDKEKVREDYFVKNYEAENFSIIFYKKCIGKRPGYFIRIGPF